MKAQTVWMVTIEEHSIERWQIPAWEGKVQANTEVEARRQAIRWAHIRENVPAFRSFLRQSVPRTSAVRAPVEDLLPA